MILAQIIVYKEPLTLIRKYGKHIRMAGLLRSLLRIITLCMLSPIENLL
jgi:hypothetical protein